MSISRLSLLIRLAVVTSSCCVGLFQTQAVAQERPAKPNFVILLADDLGWQDIKSYDTEAPYSVFETPYLDDMATEGAKFLQAYSPACVCAPSRAAILSGHHPARTNFTTVSGGNTVPQPSSLSSRIMEPYYTRRLELEQVTLPELLRAGGYINGHIGKWHMDGPDPTQHGFDYSENDRGATITLGNDRTTGFTTDLDENGFAHDQTTDNAIDFLNQAIAAEQPFFCYYASYLVHAPWHIRTESLLIKYAAKMGYDYPLTGDEYFAPGQNNPYYAAMVEVFDYNVHRIMTYLEETDDPRWPGHKLIENTYVFLTSDNGGMENGDPQGKATDNYPLDEGKIFQEEGGTRVPFFAIGPGIATNVESDVMINGLDFMPTMLSLAGLPIPDGLDGCDLATLLLDDPQDPLLVTEAAGDVRDTMYWHFPNTRMNSTIRKSGWKLFRDYDYVNNSSKNQYRLYQLYDDNGDRVDIGEANDLWDTNTVKTTELAAEFDAWLTEVGANIPPYNPNCTTPLPNQELVPAALSNGNAGGVVWVDYETTGKTAMARVDLLYTLNGDSSGQLWFRLPATITSPGHAEATVPEGTTHYLFNLIDENNFLVSYPDVGTSGDDLLDSSFAFSYVDLPDVDTSRQQVIYSEDFSSGTLDTSGLKRDSIGFCIGGSSAWEILDGKLSNASLVNSNASEGVAGCIIDLSTLEDPSVGRFTLSFDYTLAEANETLYVHVWGYKDSNSTATTTIINHGATNGNAWENASPNMTAYNLGNANGVFIGSEGIAADAAVALSGFQGLSSYAQTFDLSAFTAAPNTLGGYDYLVLGFSRNFSGTAPAAIIDNVRVSVPAAPLGTVALWLLNEGSGTIVADTSGNGFNGAATNAIWVSGQQGSALDFNGIDSTVVLPAAAFESIFDEVTISMWVFGDATQPRSDVTFNATDSSGNRVLNIHLPWSNSSIYWDAGNSGGSAYDRIDKAAPLSAFQGKWNHWVFTKNATSGSQKIYLNGSPWHSGTGLTKNMGGITAVALGSNTDGVTVNYDGKMDDVRLYDVELTEAEALSVYASSIANYTAFMERYSTLVDLDALDDPEGDGMENLLEYVLDGDPTVADAVILPELDAAGDHFIFTFTRREESVDDTIQVFQYGSDLNGWTAVNITEPVGTEVTLGVVVDGLRRVTVTLSKSAAVDGKLFGRLQILTSP